MNSSDSFAIVDSRAAPDPPTFIGKGKAEELRDMALATDCDTVAFDNELTPAQQRNLEKLLGRTAMGRHFLVNPARSFVLGDLEPPSGPAA